MPAVIEPAKSARSWWTPPEVADHLGIGPDKVVGWIRSGELAACDLSARRGVKPRYRISEQALQEFLERRSVTPSPKAPRASKRKPTEATHEYFE